MAGKVHGLLRVAPSGTDLLGKFDFVPFGRFPFRCFADFSVAIQLKLPFSAVINH